VPLKKKSLFVYLKNNKKVEFRFGPKEHSLQVSAKSVEKKGIVTNGLKGLSHEIFFIIILPFRQNRSPPTHGSVCRVP
jgi:hypothetical protein